MQLLGRFNACERRLVTDQLYCSLSNFGRSEQEYEHKGNENKSAKYGLTTFKDQIKLHLRPCAGKLLTENQTVRELITGGVPRLPYHGQFGPIVI